MQQRWTVLTFSMEHNGSYVSFYCQNTKVFRFKLLYGRYIFFVDLSVMEKGS